jgi:hypothetical protein
MLHSSTYAVVRFIMPQSIRKLLITSGKSRQLAPIPSNR